MKNLLFFSVLLLLFSNCKKNNDVDGCMDATATNYNAAATVDDGSCIVPVPLDPTCDGHETNTSLFPLVQGAVWTYDQLGTSGDYVVSINGTTTINGVEYIVADWSQFNGQSTGSKSYRIDSNGDVYYRSGAADYMEIPSSPTVGQTWLDSYGISWKVTSINASVTTGSCAYSGCVSVEKQGSSFPSVKYYKKGIGMVKSLDYSLNDLTF